MPSPTRPCGRVPPLPRCGRELENGRLQPLSCTAGEGAERSEAGEGPPVPSVRFAPLGCPRRLLRRLLPRPGAQIGKKTGVGKPTPARLRVANPRQGDFAKPDCEY